MQQREYQQKAIAFFLDTIKTEIKELKIKYRKNSKIIIIVLFFKK